MRKAGLRRKPHSRAKFGKRFANKKNKKVHITGAILVSLLLLLSWIVHYNIKPPLLAISEMRAKTIAVQILNEAIISELTYKIKYEDLFIAKADNENRITMLQANTMYMNRIASETALNIQENFRQMGTKKVGIPIGSILGSEIFANYGPRLNIGILPMGTVAANFITDFEQAGINQTRHKIYLEVNTQVRVVLPLTSDVVEVATRVPIAETIIVGDIPESYIFVPKDGLLDVVPEKAK
ncbi:MAG: sporulation protein YunB [Clostridia bacterium]